MLLQLRLYADFLTLKPALRGVKEDFKSSPLNQPGQEYPQVNSQGYARFKINAPQADSVRVSLGLGGQGGTRLSKNSDGYFSGTTSGPMDEGFHYYHLTIDGGVFNDPGASRVNLSKLRKQRASGRYKKCIVEQVGA